MRLETSFVALCGLLLAAVVEAANQPAFVMRCNPYTTALGKPAVGAKGPCDNSCYAINSGQQPRFLYYRGDRDQDAGCSRAPCSQSSGLPQYNRFGGSCDEFPMARTYRGFNPYRNLRCVPLQENQSQGGQFSGFLTRNSVQVGDRFEQAWAWQAGDQAPYYCVNPGARNPDGSNFKYVNGQFSNARRHARDVDAGSFLDATVDGEGAGLDHYLLSNDLVLSVAAGSNLTKTGFWMDGANGEDVTIVQPLSSAEVSRIAARAIDPQK